MSARKTQVDDVKPVVALPPHDHVAPIGPPEALLPGLHLDIPAERYHADGLCAEPTLSSSLAKVLLDRTPRHARLAHPRLDGSPSTRDESRFDLGSAAHEIILGRGSGFDVLEFDAYTTKAAREARDAARAAGRAPILAEQHARALAMAASARTVLDEHDDGVRLLDPEHGASEVVGIWRDIGGPLCRMMIDWLSRDMLDIVDIKTTGGGLDDASIGKTIANLSYDLSAGFYRRGQAAMHPAGVGRFRWRWLFIEDEAPHEARLFEPNGEMLAIGDRKAALAIAKWHRCLTTGEWPGYVRQVQRAEYPPWGGEKKWLEREMVDPDALRMVVSGRARPPEAVPDKIPFGERYVHLPPSREAAE